MIKVPFYLKYIVLVFFFCIRAQVYRKTSTNIIEREQDKSNIRWDHTKPCAKFRWDHTEQRKLNAIKIMLGSFDKGLCNTLPFYQLFRILKKTSSHIIFSQVGTLQILYTHRLCTVIDLIWPDWIDGKKENVLNLTKS